MRYLIKIRDGDVMKRILLVDVKSPGDAALGDGNDF